MVAAHDCSDRERGGGRESTTEREIGEGELGPTTPHSGATASRRRSRRTVVKKRRKSAAMWWRRWCFDGGCGGVTSSVSLGSSFLLRLKMTLMTKVAVDDRGGVVGLGFGSGYRHGSGRLTTRG
ncbi:hypothetical protein Hdeb2414_s0007g00238371 [Helianthus debilis subsp. tardiflorus]